MQDDISLSEHIVEDMADAVIYASLSGTIERWNQACVALFGFSKSEALGQNLDLIIPERLREAHWRGFEAAVSSGSTRLHGKATLTRAVHKDGRKLYVEMSFALVRDERGAVCGSVAVARDVTLRVEQEKLRRNPDVAGA
jgi:PAS domain S-box-containing protein